MNITVNINGADAAADIVGAFGEGLTAKIAAALSEAGELVKTEAKAECPVRTGHLRSTIQKQASGNECVIGTNCEYAGYVEFGTCKMRAHPYLIPALINNTDAIVSIIRNSVK